MIRTYTKYFPSADNSLPAIVIQITRLVNSCMLWVGTSNGRPEEAQAAVSDGNLCRDWACAMPPSSPSSPVVGTSLYRVSSSDVALPMAQRLAKRFKQQIFLSVDLPPTFLSLGTGAKLILEAERRLVEVLKELETTQS